MKKLNIEDKTMTYSELHELLIPHKGEIVRIVNCQILVDVELPEGVFLHANGDKSQIAGVDVDSRSIFTWNRIIYSEPDHLYVRHLWQIK